MTSTARLARSLLLGLSLLALPGVRAAAVPAAPAPAEAGLWERLGQGFAAKTFQATRALLGRILARANRSPRVDLKLEMALLDDQRRILLDVRGVVRVRVPGARWRERIREAQEAGRTWTMASNGPVSVDLAVTPMKLEGDEVTFTVQLDLILLMKDLVQELARAGAAVLGTVAAGALASKIAEGLAALDTEVAGKALGTAIEELSSVLSGDAGAVAYGHLGTAGQGLGRFLEAGVSGASLRRHFLVAMLYAASAAGTKVLGGTLGAGLAAALFPAGGSLVAILMATSATYWFGTWVVHQVAVKLPILWKLKKIGRLAQGRDARLGAYTESVAARLEQEMNGKANRWVFFELMVDWLAAQRKAGDFDLEPYRPLIDRARKLLQYRAVNDQDWYAARMVYQLLAAIGELPHGQPAPEG